MRRAGASSRLSSNPSSQGELSGFDNLTCAMRQGEMAGLTLDSTYSGKAFAEYLKRLKTIDAPLLFWATLNSQSTDAMSGCGD
jgi:hypothetical protein